MALCVGVSLCGGEILIDVSYEMVRKEVHDGILGKIASTGLPWWLSSKESAYNAGDLGLIAGLRRFPWRRAWQPTPVFLPRHPMVRGAWRAAVHRVAQGQTHLK